MPDEVLFGQPPADRPARVDLPAPIVQEFRALLREALDSEDDHGRAWAAARWGVYAFYDYDGEPIYVGQTNERLRTRVRRHLTNQRTDAVAMRILDVFEVAELELWPLWDLEGARASDLAAKEQLNATEYAAYLEAIEQSAFGAILNEKIPPVSEPVDLPPSRRFGLISERTRAERGHPDVRIARRAETLSRLAAVAHERGEVSDGLRRALVVQSVRLAHLAAVRLAAAEGRPAPDPESISVEGLVGSVRAEPGPSGDSWASSEATRASMRGNRGRDTEPELALRHAVAARGLDFTVDTRPDPAIRRRADLVFEAERVAVFVDGCFWHRCPEHFRLPATNVDYWRDKIDRNAARDTETNALLEDRGWTVVRVWEHDPVALAEERVVAAIGRHGDA